MARLLGEIVRLLPGGILEFTIEANPESLDSELLDVCADYGVTRISLGVQSLSDQPRRLVGRCGQVKSARSAAKMLKQRFQGKFSADLMIGLPKQTIPSIINDIDFLVDNGAGHISLYCLTVEPGTALYDRINSGLIIMPDEDSATEAWLAGADRLVHHGLFQYEVSNFARPGEECAHNHRYWNLESWIGCGPAAVSTIAESTSARAERRNEIKNIERWLLGEDPEIEIIGPKTFLEELVIMGFRQTSGPLLDRCLNCFGVPLNYFIGKTLKKWTRSGLMTTDSSALTRGGLLLLNRFLVECLEEIEKSYPRYEESRR